MSNAKQTIETGKAVLGIEFGSTRIKADGTYRLLWQISRGCKGKIRYGDHITRSDRIFRNDAWLYGI